MTCSAAYLALRGRDRLVEDRRRLPALQGQQAGAGGSGAQQAQQLELGHVEGVGQWLRREARWAWCGHSRTMKMAAQLSAGEAVGWPSRGAGVALQGFFLSGTKDICAVRPISQGEAHLYA